MLKWIADPQEQDLFQILFDTPYNSIETPIATDDLVVTNLLATPLYDGLYKFEITYNGSIDQITQLIANDITSLTFKVPKIKERQVLGLQSLLKILLFKYFGYHTKMSYSDGVITPIVDGDLLYIRPDRADEIRNLIQIPDLVGWKPIFDLTLDKTSIEVRTSDLIDLIDTSRYHQILGVPVVVVDGDLELQARAKFSEFRYDNIATIASEVYDLIQHSFTISNTHVIRRIVEQFDYKILKETSDILYLRHQQLDKQFILNNVKRFEAGRAALAIIVGDWCWNFTANFNTFVQLMYSAVQSVYQLSGDIKDVKIRVDLSVVVPITNVDDINQLTKSINQLMKDKLYVEQLRSERDAVGYRNGIPLKVFGKWVIVDTQELETTN